MSERLTTLPEKWAIERNESNYAFVNEWFNANFPEDGGYGGTAHLIHSENVFNVKEAGRRPKGHIKCIRGFTLINTNQFMEWVYNPWKELQNDKKMYKVNSYRIIIKNNTAEEKDVIICDAAQKSLPNFGNPNGIEIKYALSDYSYVEMLAAIELRPFLAKVIGVYADKAPISIRFESEYLNLKKKIASPISTGFIYPNEKVYLSVSLDMIKNEEKVTRLIIDNMPPLSTIYLEIVPQCIA